MRAQTSEAQVDLEEASARLGQGVATLYFAGALMSSVLFALLAPPRSFSSRRSEGMGTPARRVGAAEAGPLWLNDLHPATACPVQSGRELRLRRNNRAGWSVVRTRTLIDEFTRESLPLRVFFGSTPSARSRRWPT
jgi:hypothetical protein